MDSALSIIGSAASIFGAAWAFFEARKSAKAADKSERLRDEIIHRRKMMEVSQVLSETRRILNVASKVGPSCNAKLIKGINCSEIAVQIEEYTRFILEQSQHFSDFFDNEAKELCRNLQKDIELLSEASTFEDKKLYGKSIYYKILAFMPTAKALSDQKQDTTPRN